MRRVWVSGVLALLVVACGTVLGTEDDSPVPGQDAGGPATPDEEAGAPDSGSPDTNVGPAPCDAEAPKQFNATADTSADPATCAGTITRGGDHFATLGVVSMWLRFDLDQETKNAILTKSVRSITLRLQHDPTCDGNSGCTPRLNPIPGSLAAHVLRNDWVEGSGAPGGGADMCRRDTGNPGTGWGTTVQPAGANTRIAENVDYGPTVGSRTFDGNPAVGALDIPINPETLAADWKKLAQESQQISLFVVQTATGGKIVVGTREHSVAAKRPVLRVERCLP